MSIRHFIATAVLTAAAILGSGASAATAPVAGSSATLIGATAVAGAAQDRRWDNRHDRRWDKRRDGRWDSRRGGRWDNHRKGRWDRRHDRGWHGNRGQRFDRGRVCWNEYRRHQGRVTVCRRR